MQVVVNECSVPTPLPREASFISGPQTRKVTQPPRWIVLFREAGPPQHPVLTVECAPSEALKALVEPRPVQPTPPHLPTSRASALLPSTSVLCPGPASPTSSPGLLPPTFTCQFLDPDIDFLISENGAVGLSISL